MKQRTRARELALQFLYQLDLLGKDALRGLDAFLASEESDRATAEYARGLIEGTADARDDIDRQIKSVAQNWEIPRMAVIDRNVLRLATYELLFCPDVPPKVAINEAIELGKRYSTQNSGGFINGILDKVKDRIAETQPERGVQPKAKGKGKSNSKETPKSPAEAREPDARADAEVDADGGQPHPPAAHTPDQAFDESPAKPHEAQPTSQPEASELELDSTEESPFELGLQDADF